MNRAVARIDMGVVRLSNQWLERRWSAASGATTELRLPGPSGDCLTRISPEYHVDYGPVPLAARDLGEVGWSESGSASGASITLEQAGDGVYLRLETFLSHTRPGMVRQMELTNTGLDPITIPRVAVDILPLCKEEFPILKTGWEGAEIGGLPGARQLHYRALGGIRGAILIGSGQTEGFALYDPHPAFCAPLWVGDYRLPPGKTWFPPCSALFWVPEAPQEAPVSELEGLHSDWKAHGTRGGSEDLS